MSEVEEYNEDDMSEELDSKMEDAIVVAEHLNKTPQSVIKAFSADNYFVDEWNSHQTSFQQNSQIYTGYKELDDIQPLYPGLYVLGAIPSLGKTTFMHQMADQIAEQGDAVLYFSFEQSAHELYTKSLARGIRKHGLYDASYKCFSAIDIRRGSANGSNELTNQIDEYTNAVGDNMNIVQCNLYTTVEDILREVDAYIVHHGRKPVVMIDYLQIIYPSSMNDYIVPDQRFNIDHVVTALKQYQKDNDLIIMVICSLSRNNYMLPVDFESFKESGCIEYTADVVWGLNLELLFDTDFVTTYDDVTAKDGSTTTKAKAVSASKQRLMLMAAKGAPVRDVVLRAVKNRYGQASYSVHFQYEPAYDYFMEGNAINYYIRKAKILEDVKQDMSYGQSKYMKKNGTLP